MASRGRVEKPEHGHAALHRLSINIESDTIIGVGSGEVCADTFSLRLRSRIEMTSPIPAETIHRNHPFNLHSSKNGMNNLLVDKIRFVHFEAHPFDLRSREEMAVIVETVKTMQRLNRVGSLNAEGDECLDPERESHRHRPVLHGAGFVKPAIVANHQISRLCANVPDDGNRVIDAAITIAIG
ncbi:MAG: hypothetical protein BWY82_02787 [Verrucomicrobia bacterium ADurb.Bin474]|nr:MAG: hypothetical protein BWY82_02787 [Verrucomicrobia bacterium ADurb.Bin474]